MNDDLISRQAAIDFIKNHSYPVRYDRTSIEQGMTLTGIEQALNEVPSVLPNPEKDRQAAIEAINEHLELVTSELGNDSEVKKIYKMAYNHVIDVISILPAIQLNPEKDRQGSKDYCAECDHVEMCSWYPHDGCEFRETKTNQKTERWENDKDCIPRCSRCGYIPEYNIHIDNYYYSNFCPDCGARMKDVK